MSKAKGSRAERELFHTFWSKGFAAVRVAGSGSTTKPSPDILVSNGKRILAIECKSVKGKDQYFFEEEIEQLKEFSAIFGAEAWVAVRFDNKGWYFFPVNSLEQIESGKYVVRLLTAQNNSFTLESFL
jgi:holliday junction resolvase Hjr